MLKNCKIMYCIIEFSKDKIGYDMWEIKVLVPNFNLYFYWIVRYWYANDHNNGYKTLWLKINLLEFYESVISAIGRLWMKFQHSPWKKFMSSKYSSMHSSVNSRRETFLIKWAILATHAFYIFWLVSECKK